MSVLCIKKHEEIAITKLLLQPPASRQALIRDLQDTSARICYMGLRTYDELGYGRSPFDQQIDQMVDTAELTIDQANKIFELTAALSRLKNSRHKFAQQLVVYFDSECNPTFQKVINFYRNYYNETESASFKNQSLQDQFLP